MRRSTAAAIVVVAAAAALAPIPPRLVERWYSSLIYPSLQRVITAVSNLVPFALFDVACLFAIIAAALIVFRRIRDRGWRSGLTAASATLAVAAAIVYLAFLALWGLNYRRVPLAEKLVIDPARINRAAAAEFGASNASDLNRLYAASHPAVISLLSLAASFDATVRAVGGQSPIVPGRPKQTLLGGYFHQVSVSGMTDPFFLETLIAPDLLDAERPFVIAHEWAHLAGYADEAEANFIAWLTCRHGDPAARYSAALEMFGYATPGNAASRVLDPGPRIDLYAIAYRYTQTVRPMRIAARAGYDAYLKANRVQKGVESYDLVVQLILGAELDAQGYPRRR